MPQPIDVVAAVRSVGHRYWVCQRNGDGAHGGLAGLWEFPGGKVERGETFRDALAREMREEFRARVGVGVCLATIEATHEQLYPGQVFRVHFYAVKFYTNPELTCHQKAGWFTLAQMARQSHLPSGTEFIRRLMEGGQHAQG